jgi:hypothetical protein
MIPGLLEGAVIAVGAFLAGQWLPRPRLRRGTPKPSGPVCGCKRELAYHDPKSGQCHSLMYVPTTGRASSHHEPCKCKQYTGPQALPEYYAPEITS